MELDTMRPRMNGAPGGLGWGRLCYPTHGFAVNGAPGRGWMHMHMQMQTQIPFGDDKK